MSCGVKNKRAIIVGVGAKGSIGAATLLYMTHSSCVEWEVDWFDKDAVKDHHIDVENLLGTEGTFDRNLEGSYDALIYCAGVNMPCKFADPEDELEMYHRWRRSMDVNAKGALICIEQFVKYYRNKRKSIVVLVGSNTTSVPRSNSFIYGASKLALSGITKHLARDLAPKKVAIVQMDFGIVEGSPMTKKMGKLFKMDFKQLRHRQKWPESFTSEQAARWIEFVADQGHMATGNCLKIDGAEA